MGKRAPYLVISALAVTGILMVAPLYGAIPLIPHIARDLGGDESGLSLIGFAFGFPYAVACLLFGPLSDVKGRRNVLIFGVIAEAVTSLLAAASPTLSLLIFARVAQGFAAGTFGPVALGFVAEAYTGPLRHAALSILSTGLIASGSIGQIAAQEIANAFGWRSFFIAGGVFDLILVALLIVLLREPAVDRTGRSMRRTYAAEEMLLRAAPIRVTYFVGFLLYGGFVLYYSALGPHVIGAFDGSDQTVLLMRTVALPGMRLTFFTGPLIDWFAARRVVAGGLIVAAAGLAVSASGAQNATLLTAGSAVYSLGFAFAAVSMNTLLAELGGAVRGTAIAFFVFVSFTGASIAPVLYVRLAPYGFPATMTGLAVMIVLGLLLIELAVRREQAVEL